MSNLVKTFALALAGLALAIGPSLAADDDAPRKDKSKDRMVRGRVIVKTDGNEAQVYDLDDLDGDVAQVYKLPGGTMVKRAYLGVALTELSPELREHFGAPTDSGVMVSRVEPDSPAAKAGLKVGDIITSLDGKKVETSFDMQRRIRDRKQGEGVALEVFRDRRAQTISATLVEKERPEFEAGHLLQGLPNGREFQFNFDPEKFKGLQDQLQKKFNSPEFKQRFERMQDLDRKNEELDKRLREMEKKLQEMERKLKDRAALSSSRPA